MYPKSLELLLKFEEHPQHNLGWSVFAAVYTAHHYSFLPESLQNGRPAGLSLAKDDKGHRVWPCMLQQKIESQHEPTGNTFRWMGESSKRMCLCVSHSCCAAHMQFSFFTFQWCPGQEHYWDQTHAFQYKNTRHKELHSKDVLYQSAALALQREWWLSGSTFRWGEQEVSASWFSASILYIRRHFFPLWMTDEGTAAAFISIILWGMVAKVSPYLF